MNTIRPKLVNVDVDNNIYNVGDAQRCTKIILDMNNNNNNNNK